MDQEIFEKVTLIVPTFNRYPYLLRLLGYYKSYNFPIRILVLDSSTDLLEKDKFQGLLSNSRVCYQKNNFDIVTKIANGLKSVSTPYGVLCADDTFITPNGIKQSVDFLENNPDFAVAHGRYISFWLRDNRMKKQQQQQQQQQFFWLPNYGVSSNTFTDPKERLASQFLGYLPTFYGVSRIDLMKLIYEESVKFTDSDRFTELLLSMLTLIYGKMGFLDVFYAARQALLNSSAERSKKLTDFIKDGNYSEKYAKFRECLGKHLSKKAQLEIDLANKVIDDGMSIYLSVCREGKEPIKNVLVRKINTILKSSKTPDWLYEEIRSLYRKLFLANQRRMDDSRSFADTPLSKYYDEINTIYKHLLAFQIPDKNN